MTLSTHDHGNCELCEYLDQERDALRAEVARLDAVINGMNTSLTHCMNELGDSETECHEAYARVAALELELHGKRSKHPRCVAAKRCRHCRALDALDAAREGDR